MRIADVANDDDYDDHFIYDDELYPEGTLIPRSSTQGRGIKISPQKQMLQKLFALLTQLQAGNTYENLLNKIRQIVYSMYWTKQISKKLYNKLLKLI